MLDLTKRKTVIQFMTPLLVQGKNVMVKVEPWGLQLRLKKERHTLDISWSNIYVRAAILTADKAREAKKSR